MNSNVKRKFNALLQGIGNRPAPGVSEHSSIDFDSMDIDGRPFDPASSPASLRSSPRPSPAMAHDSGGLELLSKKRRVGAPTSTPSKYSSALQSSPASIRSVGGAATTVSNVTLRRWTPGSASPAVDAREGAPPPPKYCPADRGQLLRRLATFQELTEWTPKPDRVNEIEWAKRGWVCCGKERVRCTLCARELVVKVNRKEVDGKEISVLIASEIAQSVVDKYAELIVESHAEDCLWRKKGCDDSLLRLPLPNPRLALQSLRQRYDELCERAAFLPYESSLRLPPSLDLDTVISHLPPTFFTDPPPPPNKALSPTTTTTTTNNNDSINSSNAQPQKVTINRPALALALLGWQSLTNPRLNTPVPNSASCHTCLRRLGLWMFRPREEGGCAPGAASPSPRPSTPASTSEPGSGSGGPPIMDHLDPVREHRFFCPWKNPAAQRNPGTRLPLAGGGGGGGGGGERDLAAWEVLLLVLRNEAFIRGKVSGDGGNKEKDKEKKKASAGLRARSKSSALLSSGAAAAAAAAPAEGGDGLLPKTPQRPVTAGGLPSGAARDEEVGGAYDDDHDDGDDHDHDDEEARRKKDLDMMSRLRRVKSLFNTKAGSTLRRLGGSRPSTSHSSLGGV